MATCPDGHQSASEDYCDVCGMLIAGAPAASSTPGGTGLAGGSPAGSSWAGSPAGGSAAGTAGGAVCPMCNAPRSGGFCESCGYNFSTGQGGASPSQLTPDPLPVTPSVSPVTPDLSSASSSVIPGATASSGLPGAGHAAPSAAAAAAAASVIAPTGWTAVVAADRAYYDGVEAASGPDGSGIEFPAYCPERRFQLTGTEMRIGRRSPSRGIEPEIDLTGPPTDPGISRLHAVLIATQDGWAVIDPGSANGTQLNGNDIPTGLQLPVHDGDRINLGAWTTITVHHAG